MIPFKVIILLLFINGTPPALRHFFPNIQKHPLDGDRTFLDEHPVLGKHKTLEGFLFGILAGGLIGYLLGLSLFICFIAGFLSMLGDIFSSFIKRRLDLPEGTDFPVLDQAFEGLFPLLLFSWAYSFSMQATGITFLLFIFMSLGLSKLRNKKRLRPSTKSPSIVRSASSFREWRACHIGLSPLERLLNFESIIYYQWAMRGFFICTGLYKKGVMNALDVQVKPLLLSFPGLPEAFDNYRILYMSDLHIDGLDGLAERIVELVDELEVDICLLGGDYRMEMYGQFFEVKKRLRGLVKKINAKDGIFGILGNHDCLAIAPDLEESGIDMLINDSFTLYKNGEALCIVGVDDPHYYKCNDMETACQAIPSNAFSILLAHSPEIINDTDGKNIDLCLCGHTHGGQIRLPVLGPVFTHCSAPRKFSSGLWQYHSTKGYTSNGVGSSGVPIRFNCPPEIVLLTLQKSQIV